MGVFFVWQFAELHRSGAFRLDFVGTVLETSTVTQPREITRWRIFSTRWRPGEAGSVREHYREFDTWLRCQSPERIERKRAEADLTFRRVGITFAGYGDDAGTERLVPFDTACG
jgi:hypothetical protein